MAAATAADVPDVYDLVVGSHGYIFANTIDPNIPFRTQRAKYGYTPTFITRQNVSGNFGDQQQDFWLTSTQKDWSLGEGQIFFRINDADRSRQFWVGQTVDITTPGQITLCLGSAESNDAATLNGAGACPELDFIFTSSSTNLYEWSIGGGRVSRGAHGCGGTITAYATDGVYMYLSNPNGTLTRKYNISSHVFSDFCATPMTDLCYLNNTLYGVNGGTLYTIDTAGATTAAFSWKDATGTIFPLGTNDMKIKDFGGKLYIMRRSGSTNGTELWQYDSTGVMKLAEFPPNFRAYDFCVSSGQVWFIGVERRNGSYGNRTALWYYSSGTIGRAWKNPQNESPSNGYGIVPFGTGLIFNTWVGNNLQFFDIATGAISSVGSMTPSTVMHMAAANTFVIAMTGASNQNYIFPVSYSSSGMFISSLMDFESTLTKLMRGVTVDWVAGTGGDGGSIDISYAIDTVTFASFTSLQTGATSGTEYAFPANTTGRAVSIKVTINLGTSTSPPVVKRVYVRAAPTLSQFRNGEYILDCTGAGGHTPVQLRNDTSHPLSGKEMVTNFVADATSGTPLTITDRIGTYTGIVELQNLEIVEVAPEEFFIRFTTRAV